MTDSMSESGVELSVAYEGDFASSGEAFLKLIEGLPPVSRRVLILREIHELSYLEIAETLSVPIGTVRSRIARARKRLLSRDCQRV